MNLRSLFALGALVASLAVPGIASAQDFHGMDHGRQGYAAQDQGPARYGRSDEGMRGRFDQGQARGGFDRGQDRAWGQPAAQDFRRGEPAQARGWGRDNGGEGRGFSGWRR